MQDAALYDAAQEIEYLNNVTQESLRLYPPNHEYIMKLNIIIHVLVI